MLYCDAPLYPFVIVPHNNVIIRSDASSVSFIINHKMEMVFTKTFESSTSMESTAYSGAKV